MRKIALLCILFCACAPKNELPCINLSVVSKIDLKHTIPLDSIVVRTEMIPLDNNPQAPLVGAITGFCESNDYFYLVSDGIVYQYNKKGEFLRQIGAKGRGPGEYLYVKHMVCDENDVLYVFDYNTQTLLQYDSTGKLLTIYRRDFQEDVFIASSFLLHNDKVIFTSSTNSERMDLLAYDSFSGDEAFISKREREMGMEGIMGVTLSFGSHENPYLFHYFNDTVYRYRDHTLIPELIIKMEPKPTFAELADLSKGFSGGIVQISDLVQGGDFLFITYNDSRVPAKQRWELLMSLYNTNTNQYAPHVTIVDSESPYLSISSGNQLFQGLNVNTLFMVQTPAKILETEQRDGLKEDDNPILIKYQLK